jgi:DNA-directed RNA polymerase specialized sigma24 family protein
VEAEPQQEERCSVEELSAAIASLSEADHAKIILAARYFSHRCKIREDDLRQEAFCLIFEGRRTCKRGVPIVAFICGVIRGLASDGYKARGRSEIPVPDLHEGVVPVWHQEAPTPEDAAISRLTDAPMIAEIEAMVAGDEQLELLLQGLIDHMRGAELQELLGVDVKGLAAARKRLSRALTTKYPKRKPS